MRSSMVALTRILALWAAACRPEGSPRGAITGDSAGVTIVVNASPAWPRGQAWTVDAMPVLDLGTAMGDSLYEFGSVMGALRLTDGRIVVADDRAKQLRVYSPEGAFLQAVGRRGRGPGEFDALGGVYAWRADSIAAFDYSLRRVTLYSTQLAFGRALEFRNTPGYWVQGVVQDSLLLLRSFGSAQMPLEVPGTYWDSTWLILVGPAGQTDTIGRFPQRKVAGAVGRDLRTLLSNPDFVQLAPVLSATAARTHIVIGTGESFSIDLYDTAGSLVRGIRRTWKPESVDGRYIQDYKQKRVEFLLNVTPNADATSLRERVDRLMYLDTKPAFLGIFADPDGGLWVSSYRMPWQEPGYWSVFDSAGTWLGDVQQPRFDQVFQIGRDFVLTLSFDDAGAQHVRVHRLNRH